MSDLTEALTQYSLRGATTATEAAKAGIGTDMVLIVAAARRWDALDSDENVEVAAKAMLGPYRWEHEGPRQVWKELARAALRAVKAGEET